jgi:hypothetical protein
VAQSRKGLSYRWGKKGEKNGRLFDNFSFAVPDLFFSNGAREKMSAGQGDRNVFVRVARGHPKDVFVIVLGELP